MSNIISGNLGYKGETGLSAYELAVQNGYQGTEQDWLATLGTSSHFTRTSTVYETEEADQTEFVLPEGYTSSCFIEVFVAGIKEKDEDITIDVEEETITLSNAVATIGTEVEVVMITMSTNNLPISDTINSSSTNDTASGSKAVYDYIEDKGYVPYSDIVYSVSCNGYVYASSAESVQEQTIEIGLPSNVKKVLGVVSYGAWATGAGSFAVNIPGCICTGFDYYNNKFYVYARMLTEPSQTTVKMVGRIVITYIKEDS